MWYQVPLKMIQIRAGPELCEGFRARVYFSGFYVDRWLASIFINLFLSIDWIIFSENILSRSRKILFIIF